MLYYPWYDEESDLLVVVDFLYIRFTLQHNEHGTALLNVVLQHTPLYQTLAVISTSSIVEGHSRQT